MQPSLRALMTEIIDYAGLFPPAKLELTAAFDRFLAHSAGPEGWMLARFVIPAVRLVELAPLLGRRRHPQDRIRLSVLGRGGTSAAGITASLGNDAAEIARFLGEAAGQAEIDQLEVRLPDDPAEIPAAVQGALDRLEALPGVLPFFEASLLDGWRGRLPRAVAAVAASDRPAGLKIRCGGLDAAAVPSPVAVAAALSSCRRSKIPLKATQGLHHPVRHFDRQLETTVHGFVNLFVGGVLGCRHALPEDRLLDIIEDEDPMSFRFGPSSLSWRDVEASVDDIAAARRSATASFGSCSFSEPRDDLRALGWLDEETT